MGVNICVPTLNRYDLLTMLIRSAEKSDVPVDYYFVIDNGMKLTKDYFSFVRDYKNRLQLYVPLQPMGVAESWNRFIITVPEERIIVNDDLIFDSKTIGNVVSTPGDLVYITTLSTINMFSFFLIRNSCVKKIGMFDESISPGYAYFEDNDYFRRMELGGVTWKSIASNVNHLGSQTMKAYTPQELEAHHQKFRRAQSNYVRKWGDLPGKERFDIPYGK